MYYVVVLVFVALVLFVVFALETADSLAECVTAVALAAFGVYVAALVDAGVASLMLHGAGQVLIRIQQAATYLSTILLNFLKTALLV
jgi:hypothetical protein